MISLANQCWIFIYMPSHN